MKSVTIAFAVMMAFGLSSASAQDKPAAGAAPTVAPAGGGNTVMYKSKTVYDFDDDTVEGDMVRPDGELVDTRRGSKHSSLIKIRDNFIPEMLKSVEGI